MGRVWGLGGRSGVKEARGFRRHVIRTGSSEEATEQVVGDLLHLLQGELVREGERAGGRESGPCHYPVRRFRRRVLLLEARLIPLPPPGWEIQDGSTAPPFSPPLSPTPALLGGGLLTEYDDADLVARRKRRVVREGAGAVRLVVQALQQVGVGAWLGARGLPAEGRGSPDARGGFPALFLSHVPDVPGPKPVLPLSHAPSPPLPPDGPRGPGGRSTGAGGAGKIPGAVGRGGGGFGLGPRGDVQAGPGASATAHPSREEGVALGLGEGPASGMLSPRGRGGGRARPRRTRRASEEHAGAPDGCPHASHASRRRLGPGAGCERVHGPGGDGPLCPDGWQRSGARGGGKGAGACVEGECWQRRSSRARGGTSQVFVRQAADKRRKQRRQFLRVAFRAFNYTNLRCVPSPSLARAALDPRPLPTLPPVIRRQAGGPEPLSAHPRPGPTAFARRGAGTGGGRAPRAGWKGDAGVGSHGMHRRLTDTSGVTINSSILRTAAWRFLRAAGRRWPPGPA